jgi:hypothetical protein
MSATKFTGVGLHTWNVAKVTTFEGGWTNGMFEAATALTSCNKRRIADAWTKSNSLFKTTTTYVSAWAGETCAKVIEWGIACEVMMFILAVSKYISVSFPGCHFL